MSPETFSFEDAAFDQPQNENFSFEDAQFAPEKTTTKKSDSILADVGGGLISGAGQLVELPGQLYGLSTGDFDTWLSNAGKGIQNYGHSIQSDVLKDKLAAIAPKIKAAEDKGLVEGIGTAIGEYVSDPRLLASGVAESVPSMIGSMGAGFAAKKGTEVLAKSALEKMATDVAAKKVGQAAATGAIGFGATQQGAQVGTQAYEDTFVAALKNGLSPQQAAEAALPEAQKAGLAAGAISAITAKILPSIEKNYFEGAGEGVIRRIIKGGAGEFSQEALESGGGHLAQNLAVKTQDKNKDVMEGVASQAGVGGLLGGIMGGGAGIVSTGPKSTEQFNPDEEPPIQEQEMPTSEQLLLEAPRGEVIDVTPEGEASTKTERDALALRALPAPKQDSGVFIDHPERGMVQLTQAQADRLRERLQEMHDNGLTPDVMAAQRNRGTGIDEKPIADTSVKALPAPSVIPNVFIGGKEGLKPATTADIIPQPTSGQITPQVYRFGKSGEALESEPVVGQGYNKITLPNGDNVAAIVTAIGKDGRAVITTDDGRKLRPLVSKTKFYAEPKVIEPTRQEFRPESPTSPPAQENYKGPTVEEIDSAATETHTQPTQAQKEAGNYTKGQVNWNGLNISIENPRGSERSGVDKGGRAWSVTMPDHYGYIKQTEGKDGDHLDIYMGKKPDSNNVYVIDQVNTENGKFDEHKIMVGYPNKKAALTAYQRAFSDGKANERIGSVTELTVPALKNWMEYGDTKVAIAKQIKPSQNLIEFIASKGGISSSDLLVGDLKAMDLHKVFIPRMGKLINKNGLPLDQLRQMAIESGYLKDTDSGLGEAQSTIDDFLQLLSKGKKVYSANDIERQLDYENLQNSQSEDVFDEEYKNQYKAEQAAADEREYYASRDDATVRGKGAMYGLSFAEDTTVDDMNRAIAEVEEGFKFQKSEPTPIGEQFIIDGTEKSAKQLAQAKEETNKGFIAPKAAQKPADIGLFKAADAREKSEREPTLFRTSEPTDKVRINFLKAMSANDAAIQKQLSDYVDKVYGNGVGAKLVESLQSEGGETTGAFSPKTKLAYIALNDSKGVRNLRDILNTTRHEVIHALRNSNAIPAKDWQILEQAAKQRWMKRYGIDKAYSNLKEGAKLEEAIAEAMADRQNIKEGPVIKRILESMAQFFGKIKNFFDKQEFRSSEDIFKDVENGKYAPAKAESEFNSRVQENVVSLTGLTPDEFTTQASAFLQRAKQSEVEPLKRLNDMNWWTRTMVTPRTIASMFKEATPLVDSAERMMERSSTIVNQLHDSMKPYFGMDVNAQKKLNRWFEYARIKGIEKYTGSVINDVKETKPYYDDKGEYHVPPTLSKNGEVITLNKEEADAANAVHKGFEKAADMWRDMTLEENGFTKQGDPKTYAELNAYMEASKAGRKGTTPKEVARLTQEVRKADYAMRGLQEAEALRKGYVPFVRRGKFGVSVYDKENRRLEFRRFDEKDAKKNMDELRSKYPVLQGYRIGDPSEIASYKANVQPGLFGVLDDISHMSGLNDEQHAALRDNLEKRMSQQGFRRHRIASDNIAGYSTDFHIAIPEYITGVSNYISKRVYKPKMDKAVGAMTRKPNLHKWGQDYVSYVMSPQEEMQKVRYLASLYYLSTNPSSMIVNSTQPALVSLPYLSMFSNPLKAAGQMARAYKDVASMIDGGQKGSMSGVINLDKAPADVKADLIIMRDKGSLLPLQMDEFTANSKKEGTFSSPAAEALAKYTGEPIAKVTKFLTDMYGSVEQMNRLVTGIASLRLYKADQKFAEKVSKIMEKDPLFAQEGAANSAADFANWVNKETHFRYGKINRPEMGRGKIGTTALQFRSFLQNTIELLYRMHGQGREGRLALLSVYLPIALAAAGLMGLPGSQDVLNMTQYAYNTFAKEKKDFKQELRETLTNLAPWMKGEVNGYPISYLMMNGLSPTLGSNIGSRIGMNLGLNPNVKPQDGMEYLAGFTPITDAIVGTSLRAISLAKQGRNIDAAATFLPSGFRNPLTALQWSKEGVRTGSGRLLRPAEDLSTSELVSKAIGFTPVKNAILGEELGAKGFAKTADTDYRSQVYGRLARTLADISKAPDAQSKQDAQQKYQSIINEIVDYNKTATKPITADQIRQSIRSRMGEEMMGAKGRKAPKPLQRRYQEIQESFGDDGDE